MNMMSPTPSIPFLIPIGIEAHEQAEQLRRYQSNARKGKQVYLNTLAIYAVHQFLDCLGIESNLNLSTSQDYIQASLSDANDLMISGIGRVDCCPVLPGEDTVTLAAPTHRDRLGCIAVQLDAELRYANLLGFVKHWHTDTLPLQQFAPLSSLLEYIETLKQRVDLKLWFEQVITHAWKTMDEVLVDYSSLRTDLSQFAYRNAATPLPDTIPALIDLFQSNDDHWTQLQILSLMGAIADGDAAAIAFLSELITTHDHEEIRQQAAVSLGYIQPDHEQAGVRRAKVLELGMQVEQQALLLVLTLTPTPDHSLDVNVRLYPTSSQMLPPNLHLGILDEAGTPLLEEHTHADDDWVQLNFSGSTGDRFTIQLTLGSTHFREAFIL